MDPVFTGLIGVLVPMGIAAGVWLATGSFRREDGGGWTAGASVALALLAAQTVVSKAPSWPPLEAADWRGWAALALVPVAFASARAPAVIAAILRFALCVALPYLQFASLRAWSWSTAESAAWILGMGAASFLLWEATRRLAARLGATVDMPAILVVVGSVSAFAVAGSGSALLGQLLGALAAAVGALALIPSFRRQSDRAGLIDGFAPLWFALLAEGHHFASLERVPAVLIALSLFAPWAIEAKRPANAHAATAVRVAATLALLAWPLWTVAAALLAAPPPSSLPY